MENKHSDGVVSEQLVGYCQHHETKQWYGTFSTLYRLRGNVFITSQTMRKM